MGPDSDLKLTHLAAEILRDAVRDYEHLDSDRLLAGFNSAQAMVNPAFSGGGATSSFPAATGSFLAATGSLRALTSNASQDAATGSPGRFKALTGSLRAVTQSFQAVEQEPAGPAVTLKRVFKLPGRLSGVQLPPEPDLGAMAHSAPTMARLGELAAWLGTGSRPITETDELTSDDAADAARQLGIQPLPLSLLWEYALTSGWFEPVDSPDRASVVIGRTAWRWADGDDAGALHVWAAVFAAVAATALDVVARSAPDPVGELNFEGQGVALLVKLFLVRRRGMTRRAAEDFVRDGAIGAHPAPPARRHWDAWVAQHGDPAHLLLRELADLQAVTLAQTPEGTVRLTPLALWALREQFALDDVNVPVLAPPSGQMSGANLVALADAVSAAEFDAAFAIWMHGRDPGRAAQELLIYAGSAEPRGRLTAVNVVRRMGLAAYGAWEDALKRPELRGYAQLTLAVLAAKGAAAMPPAADPDPEDMTWVAGDLLALGYGTGEPDPDEIAAQFAEAVPAGQEAWVLGLMARSSNPDVARVLDVLAADHPDHRIARDAGRAARAVAKNRRRAARRQVPAS
ncbi:MAG TPA: hypothetical protein VHF26_14220 [Trebonia sp.]|nr:hypothetical protein [Trebonia sp.]